MNIWKVNYCHGDGYTYWGTDCISIHKSEEGAALNIDVLKEIPDEDFPSQKKYPVNDHCSFEVEPAILED